MSANGSAYTKMILLFANESISGFQKEYEIVPFKQATQTFACHNGVVDGAVRITPPMGYLQKALESLNPKIKPRGNELDLYFSDESVIEKVLQMIKYDGKSRINEKN